MPKPKRSKSRKSADIELDRSREAVIRILQDFELLTLTDPCMLAAFVDWIRSIWKANLDHVNAEGRADTCDWIIERREHIRTGALLHCFDNVLRAAVTS